MEIWWDEESLYQHGNNPIKRERECQHEFEDEVAVRIEFDEKVKETNKAILFSIKNRLVWIPKSQITNLYKTKLSITEWLYLQKKEELEGLVEIEKIVRRYGRIYSREVVEK